MRRLFRKCFIEQTDHSHVQFIRYLFVGGFAFLIDFSLLYVLTEFSHYNYLISAAISFCTGLFINYILSTCWVFSQRNYSNRWVEFLFFLVIGIIGLGLNELFLWILTGALGIYYLGSKLISTVFVYLWNFFARKYLLFNKQNG